MKWNFLLLLSSLFWDTLSASDIKIKAKFRKKLDILNITMPEPIVTASPGLIADTYLNKKSRRQQVKATTSHVLQALATNPEIFCKWAISIKKAQCDTSGALVPPKFEVATKELIREDGTYRAGHIYTYGKENTIALGTTGELNAQEQFFTIPHELDHLFWKTQHLSECTSEDKERKQARFRDINLMQDEILSAPYNSTTKATFIQALLEGEQKISELRAMKNTLMNSSPNNLQNATLKKIIDCYEEEAKKSPFVQSLGGEGPSPLIQVLDKLEYEISLTKTKYMSPSAQFFEECASINGVLSYSPALFNLFDKLRQFYAEYGPSNKKCVDKIAPRRLTLSCMRN